MPRSRHRKTGKAKKRPKGTGASFLIQAPIGAGLFQAITSGVRRAAGFLWIPDLAAPDLALAAVAGALAAAAAGISAEGSSARSATVIAGLLTFILAWRLTAGVAVYWAASNAVGLGQAILLRRRTAT